MKVLPYFFLLLGFPMMLGAQALPSGTGASARQPLNLSLHKSLAPASDATVILLPPASGAGAALPYGAGYENRQQGGSAGSGASSGSGGSGRSGIGAGHGPGGPAGAGNGGGGRGGSGGGR